MSKTKKIILIILCTLAVIVLTAVIFCCTLFTIKDIKVDYRTSTTAGYSNSDIIENSGIKEGKCVFFMHKQEYIDTLEKKFPYLEVINIEVVIPCHVIIHVAERQETFAVKYKDKTLLCDHDFKVLKIQEEEFVSSQSNAVYVDNLSVNNENVEAGDFLDIKEKSIKKLFGAMLENSRSYEEFVAMIKSVSVFSSTNQITSKQEEGLKLKTFADREIYIHNSNFGITYKIQKALSILSAVTDIQKFKYDEIVYDREDINTDQTAMSNILLNLEIHVQNYSVLEVGELTEELKELYRQQNNGEEYSVNYTERDCFYYLIYGEKELTKV